MVEGSGFESPSDDSAELSELALQTSRKQAENPACSRAWDNPAGVWRVRSNATEQDPWRHRTT